MSHQALFSAVLSLEKPLLTSLTASSSSSPIPTTIPSSCSKSSKSSKSTISTSKSKSKSRRPSISSDSDSSFTPTFTQRKRKYDDDQQVPGDTPLNKKLRRQQQNRQAAHTSRIKKKLQMDALQQQVSDLIAANRLLQEKVTALQSEVASNRALLQDESSISTPITDVSTPITLHDSPISTTESPSPESPISPIPVTMKSPISPLSDSDASMDTSSTSLPTSDFISTSTSTSTSSSLPISTSTSTSLIDVIPSSTRCYDPAVPTNGEWNVINEQTPLTLTLHANSFDFPTSDMVSIHNDLMYTQHNLVDDTIFNNEHVSFDEHTVTNIFDQATSPESNYTSPHSSDSESDIYSSPFDITNVWD